MNQNRWIELILDNTQEVFDACVALARKAENDLEAGERVQKYLERQLTVAQGVLERAMRTYARTTGMSQDLETHYSVLLMTLYERGPGSFHQRREGVDWTGSRESTGEGRRGEGA